MARKQTIIEEFDPKRVRPLPDQPRKRFAGIRELADSIAEIGQSCPGIVTLVNEPDGKYDAQLIDGERRLRACKLIGGDQKFRAEVRDSASIEDLFVASFGANFGKQEHDAIEIAEGLRRMRAAGKTAEQCARIAGRSVGWVSYHLRLLDLHPQVQQMMVVPEGKEKDDRGREAGAPLTVQLAQLLVLLDEATQLKVARQIVAEDGMSVAAARRMILKVRHKSGDGQAYGGGNHTHAKARGAIKTIVESFTDRLGVFIDMPGSTFNTMVDGMQPFERRNLRDGMGKLIDSLEMLRDSIEERILRAKARA